MANIGSMQAPPPDASQLGNQGSGQGEPTSSGSPSSAGAGAPSGAAGHDIKIFGNLEGRDPDLLFAGEKIMINGKAVTVADGDTLSSLAAKYGTTVDKLISENKMDASLNGKNGPNGAWFTPGGPQPANGGSTTPPPNATTTTTQASNTTASNNTPTSNSTTPPSSTNSDGNPPVRAAHLGPKDSAGLEGGPIDQARLKYLLMQPLKPPEGTELTDEQLARVQQILKGLSTREIKNGGADLDQQDKNILNLWMKENRVALAVPGTGTGTGISNPTNTVA
jgi:LysM repeat protein